MDEGEDHGLAPGARPAADRVEPRASRRRARRALSHARAGIPTSRSPRSPASSTSSSQEGKIGAYGAEQRRRRSSSASARGRLRLAAVQNSYSLLDREVEAEVLPLCAERGLGFSRSARSRRLADRQVPAGRGAAAGLADDGAAGAVRAPPRRRRLRRARGARAAAAKQSTTRRRSRSPGSSRIPGHGGRGRPTPACSAGACARRACAFLAAAFFSRVRASFSPENGYAGRWHLPRTEGEHMVPSAHSTRTRRVVALAGVLVLIALSLALSGAGAAGTAALTFAAPSYVDQQLAGGEPEIFADTLHGTLIYSSHEGTTHLYRDGIVSSPWGDFSFVGNYCNQVNVWTSPDNGANWYRDRYLGTTCPTVPRSTPVSAIRISPRMRAAASTTRASISRTMRFSRRSTGDGRGTGYRRLP